MPWHEVPGPKYLLDGIIQVVESQGSRVLIFETYGGGEPLMIHGDQIRMAAKRSSGINSVVDILIDPIDEGDEESAMCLVGPRGRMKKLFKALGHRL